MIAATLAALALAPPAADRAAAGRGARWLAAASAGTDGGAEADAVLALVAAHVPEAVHLATLRRLAATYATGPGAAAKTALAAVAAGRDPRCFGGVDLVHQITQGYADGVYGATIWDDALSIAALARAGERVPAAAIRRLRAARRTGGWGFSLSPGTPDDADSTGLVLIALRASGATARDRDMRAGAAWLLSRRLSGAGWAGAAGSGTDANSTGLALRGLAAAGRVPPASATRALRSLQLADGSFAATAGAVGSALLATNEAVPALLRVALPGAARRAPGTPCGAPVS